MAQLHFKIWRWAVYSIAQYEKLPHLFSARDVAFFGVGRFNDSKNLPVPLQFLLSFATSLLDVMFETREVSGVWFDNQPRLSLLHLCCLPQQFCETLELWVGRRLCLNVDIKSASWLSSNYLVVKKVICQQLETCTAGPKPQEMAGRQWGIDVILFWRNSEEDRLGFEFDRWHWCSYWQQCFASCQNMGFQDQKTRKNSQLWAQSREMEVR